MRRLILFDIDGTLAEGGPAKEAFCEAMLSTFGTIGSIGPYSFAGKTDPQIARELLIGSGFKDAEVNLGLPSLWNAYVKGLKSLIAENPMVVLPGIPELIQALKAETGVALGLVTGNIVRGADIKIRSIGLEGDFQVGAYGSDHEDRKYLPGIALKKATEMWGVRFSRDCVFVVGDTPRDVSCGKYHGTRTMAVATGPFNKDELLTTGADTVFEDFSEVSAVLKVLLA